MIYFKYISFRTNLVAVKIKTKTNIFLIFIRKRNKSLHVYNVAYTSSKRYIIYVLLNSINFDNFCRLLTGFITSLFNVFKCEYIRIVKYF